MLLNVRPIEINGFTLVIKFLTFYKKSKLYREREDDFDYHMSERIYCVPGRCMLHSDDRS